MHLGSISRQLGLPKSTLFNWESDPSNHRAINVMKSLQLEKLQEKYIPSFEEELQRLSTCLNRIECALEKQDYDAMRPEFLLRTSLQLRSRLNKLRSDVQPSRTLDHGELPPNPLPGCITRSQSEIPDSDEFGVPASAGRASNLPETPHSCQNNEIPNAEVLPPRWDENKNFSEPQPSAPATSNDQNSTIVPNSTPAHPSSSSSSSNPEPLPPGPGRERYGDLATPLSRIPVDADSDQISLTAGFGPPRLPAQAHQNAPIRPSPPSRTAKASTSEIARALGP